MITSDATCGCCAGVSQSTPLAVDNRPGLAALAYRVGTHTDFLASLRAGLTDPARPELGNLGTRDADDFTLALLDAWAVAADVLTFYNERLASESYLRTARERASVGELGRLIGYRLRPGVAAETYVAFALEAPPELPAAARNEPGSAPPVTPASVQLEKGLRVQSIPGPDERPQTFETVEELEARPEWNAIPVRRTRPQTFALGDRHAYLAGTGGALNLKPGDLLLLAGPEIPAERWDVRTITRVIPDTERDRTRVEWTEGLGSPRWGIEPSPAPQAYIFRKRIPVFGHNAPARSRVVAAETGTPPADSTDWEFALSPAGSPYVDLDGSHPDVVHESMVVLAKPTYRELWRVDDVAELSRAAFAVSGKVTRLKLKGGENYDLFADEVRATTVYAASEQLTLSEAPEESAVRGDSLDVTVDVSAMPSGHRLLLRGTTTAGEEHVEAAVVEEVQPIAGGWRIVLGEELGQTYQRESVVLHGNVALATHGETVHQLLGSGRAGEPFQRFDLAHEPLTHVQSTASAWGAEPELEVFVNDVRWEERPTLYAAGRRDRVYTLRNDERGRTYVQFGDGARGARPPTGSNNVRARYRKGVGAAGNVKAGTLAQLLDRPLGVKGVSNPMPASGGVDAEAEQAARRTIPLGVRTLDRAVSLLDYEDFALAFTGVAKANATVVELRGEPTIVVSVAFEGGERLDDLAAALRQQGDRRVPLRVLAATTTTFRLALRVAIDPAREDETVLAAVESALRSAYAFTARDLSQPVFLSELVAIMHRVPGVLAVDVDRLYAGAAPGRSERLDAQRAGPAAAGSHAVPAGVLVLDPAPFDWLETIA
jgi:uncharacterized phage protein gp47/JayE